ncbi:membrane-anchored junction protein isoform X2 [Canis aureus]
MSNELLGLNQNKITDLLHKSLSRILPHLSKGFIYSFMRDREKGAETESEGEAGSSQGAQRGTRFQIPRPRPEPKANAQPLSHPGISVKSYHLGAMSLKPFTYPFPETRFLHAGPNVYKFKIRYGNNIRELPRRRWRTKKPPACLVTPREGAGSRIFWMFCGIDMDSIRVVLGNLDSLQPFATEHFIIFPYKSKWESISHLKFKHGEIVLVPYPFVFTLYVEMKWFHESLSPGPHREESSRSHDEETKTSGSAQLPQQARAGQGQDRDFQPKPQQKEAPYGNQEDSKSEDSPAGQIIPPLQQNNPLPPKGPTELATGGFFGFLSSLFPFRYFFRKSSQ